MTSAQIDGLSRAALSLISGVALAYGIGDAATWATITGAVAALVSAAWSVWSNASPQLVHEAAKSPDVTQIVMDTKELADAQPNPKVVS